MISFDVAQQVVAAAIRDKFEFFGCCVRRERHIDADLNP